MEIWTSDCLPIDAGLAARAVKTGKKNSKGNDLYTMKKKDNCHENGDVYKLALYNSDITPQTAKYSTKGEVTNANYPKGGVTVDVDIVLGKRAQVNFKQEVVVDAAAKFAILYNASKQNKALLAYRFADGEEARFEQTNIYA